MRAVLQLVKADAERHASLISSLSKEISSFSAPDMPTLVEYVRDTNARLGIIMANEAAVLEQFPTWPQVSDCHRNASTLHLTDCHRWSALRRVLGCQCVWNRCSPSAMTPNRYLLAKGESAHAQCL
jgi:hypothetical protein